MHKDFTKTIHKLYKEIDKKLTQNETERNTKRLNNNLLVSFYFSYIENEEEDSCIIDAQRLHKELTKGDRSLHKQDTKRYTLRYLTGVGDDRDIRHTKQNTSRQFHNETTRLRSTVSAKGNGHPSAVGTYSRVAFLAFPAFPALSAVMMVAFV